MTKRAPVPPKDELESKYSQFGVTISQLSREYKVSNPVVRSWLISYGIERKSHKEASTEANSRKRSSPPPKETLQRLYSSKTIDELEAIFSVGQQTIHHWLDSYGIQRKSLSEAVKSAKKKVWESMAPSKELFLAEYDKVKNLTALEAKFDLSSASIKRLVKDYEVVTHKPWRSAAEIELFEKLQADTHFSWEHSNKSIVNPFELDIVCHDKKLAVEYCGLYWHSENKGEKSRDYHLKKLQKCHSKGYSLVTVFESDDKQKVLSSIKARLGLNRRICARECSVKEIDSGLAKHFNEANHMHGHHQSSVNLGLFCGSELVMVLSMGKSRFNTQYEWECIRMTGKSGTTVIGGASKLFNSFRKLFDPKSIITYSDRRFGEGTVYLNCGFTREEDTGPNYWYFSLTDSSRVFSRVAFQKHKLKDMSAYDEMLTEWEIMKASKFDRIWDCGNAKYVWNK